MTDAGSKYILRFYYLVYYCFIIPSTKAELMSNLFCPLWLFYVNLQMDQI